MGFEDINESEAKETKNRLSGEEAHLYEGKALDIWTSLPYEFVYNDKEFSLSYSQKQKALLIAADGRTSVLQPEVDVCEGVER